MNNDFITFLRSVQEKEKGKTARKGQINPTERIEYFQNLVKEFFQTLENEWFKDSLESGLMHIEKQAISITEETLGQYYTERCRLTFGHEIVDFIPIGTILIGTDGRIDMKYKQNRVMFVHVRENVKCASDLIEIRINGEWVSKQKKMEDESLKKVWKLTYGNLRTSYEEASAQTVQQLIIDLFNAKA